MEMGGGGGLKIFARKGGLGKVGVVLEMRGLPYNIVIFLEIPHYAA